MSVNSAYETMGADFVRNLGQAVRRNPVSTALIGMGVLWLFSGGKTVDAAQRLARRGGLDRLPDAAADALSSGRAAVQSRVNAIGEQLSEAGESAGAMVGAASQTVRDTASGALDRASRLGSEVAESASGLAHAIPERSADLLASARSRLSDMFEEQPLLLGAVGLAIGAGIAASLPTTRLEAEYFGDSSDELKARASEFVGEQAGRVQEFASDAVDAAGDEARRQGLTPEQLKAEAGEVGDKIKRAADHAGSRIQSAEQR
ncbi:hypothetical protein [Rhodopseudomonas palustris]|uniref:DUF3618 domain-containing protein n=1 Tax=Rhodopseudomonas palustris (strain BisB18) TaxID=316056 RepID=Q20XL6_RHOPB